jgi:Protein of unknown function (DUF4058)
LSRFCGGLAVPLLDHFHPHLSQRRPWESFHSTWATALADALNRDVLPPGYIALETIHSGAPVEIDVATFHEEGTPAPSAGNGTNATEVRTVWTPATAPLVLPAEFPERCTVKVLATGGSRTLVAAIELVSPGNKDRESKRRLFTARCATYLARGVGVVIVDVVTSRQANLHNELLTLLGIDGSLQMPRSQDLYTAGYRPLSDEQSGRIETWPMPLAVGQRLPTVPLSLGAELCLPVDLEGAYLDACQRRRLGEALA